MGNTNVGKTTFLNNLLGFGHLLNTSELRETNCIWKIKPSDRFQIFSKFYEQGKIIEIDSPEVNDEKELKKLVAMNSLKIKE